MAFSKRYLRWPAEHGDVQREGFVYDQMGQGDSPDHHFFIENLVGTENFGLTIERDGWESDDLRVLETRLARWMEGEGVLEGDFPQDMARGRTEQWVATMDTEHFSFVAVGDSESDAASAMYRGWVVHMRQTFVDEPIKYTFADLEEMYGVNISRVGMDTRCQRDGEPL